MPPNEPLSPAAVSCRADYDFMTSVVRRDYAGFPDKVPGHESALAALEDSVGSSVRAAADLSACTAALVRWIGFFHDHHLQVYDTLQTSSARRAPTTPVDSAAARQRVLSVRWLDDSTAVLRLPNFGQRQKPAIDSLVAAHRARLLATPYLIIDIRGNGGGWTGSYSSVIPLVYTGPIRMYGMEAWASEGNIANVREMLGSPNTPEEIKAQIRAMLPRLEAGRGTFVVMEGEHEFRLDTVHPLPRSVAILVDRLCASTCEQFVLDAGQSSKVTVFGTANTGGFLDYGNVRTIRLPSGERTLRVPTTRSGRLPEQPLDATGIAPEVRIPRDEADAVEFARRYLHSQARSRPN
ncbi:MAG TPA: S41 family peptidase [Longimicrobiaceae bacterium]|nr:S41 family peptidase [Longimicrobiaceae bacterium]